jgi:hypothetical protein
MAVTVFTGMFVLASTAIGQEGPTPLPTQAKELLNIVEPTQGRPVIVRPEDNFYFMYWTDNPEIQKIDVSLVNCLSDHERVALLPAVRPYQIQKTYWAMLLKVPAQAQSGVYDLFINLGEYYQRVPRAVRILSAPKKAFRFVHLSNMNIGEPTAPDFDTRLLDEINLLNPEFVIATGDFVESAGPDQAEESWTRIRDFFGQLTVPTYLVCGDLEDPAVFQRRVDARPVGSFDYGSYHFVLMMDTQRHPINQHRSNIEAILQNLKEAPSDSLCCLVGRSEDLWILDGLRGMDLEPAEAFSKYRIRMMISGGSTDWDYLEHAEKLDSAKLAGVDYIRTGQSSTSIKNGGTGLSHYRVFDVDGSNVNYVYSDESSSRRLQYSITVGRLRLFAQGPNDGSQTTERISVLNALNQSFSDCRVVFKLKGTDPSAVRVFNGRLEQVLTGQGGLIVLASVNLPEKSTVQVLATTDSAQHKKYEKLPVEFSLSAPKPLSFQSLRSEQGLTYLEGASTLELSVKNLSKESLTVRLQARLAGQVLMIHRSTPAEGGSPSLGLTTETVTLKGEETEKITIVPAVRSITPGEHVLSVYCLDDPLERVWTDKVDVVLAGDTKP